MTEKKNEEVKNYTIELQKTYLDILLTDGNAFTRCQNIIKPEYFHDRLKPAVRYILTFADEYRALPLPEQIKAETNVDLQQYEGLQPQHVEWCLDEVENFCRHRAVELVSFESADLIPQGKYSEFEDKLKEALTISLQTDLGTSYWEDPKSRIQAVLDRQDVVSTGWKALDNKLYGGFTKGTLNIFAGGSGSGKSLFLQNLALNWAFMGMDVIYFSLELSENLVSARLDSMVTGYSTKEIFRKIDDVDFKVKYAQKNRKAGDLRVKKLSEAGTSANDMRAYLKEYEIQTGKRPTAVLVDYLDLMYPNNKKINPSDMFVKDKFVAEELRALASEYHLLFATASQLNRGSVEANGEFDHSHIAGGISKINTADNVFGIYTTPAMKERGEYQLQMLKTRSSASVGQRIDLGFDVNSLVIRDPDPDTDVTQTRTAAQIASEIKSNTGTSVNMSPIRNSGDAAVIPKASANRTDMIAIMKKVRGQ
jgi:archaellum biogenesis ATPase FlaH